MTLTIYNVYFVSVCHVEGHVYDFNYQPLSGAIVMMPDIITSVRTDSNGFYSYTKCFTNTIIGLTVSMPGYETRTFYGPSTGFDIRMSPYV